MNAPPGSVVFAAEVSPGTARRTASIKKNLITITSMLRDLNFYLYALLHLCTTFSILVLAVVFPPLIWEQNPSMNIWSVSIKYFYTVKFIMNANACTVFFRNHFIFKFRYQTKITRST